MAHYGMLRDYKFSDDVDEIRGDIIYAADKSKLGKVADVIFEHDTGAIRYLVADIGHDRKVLVPSNHVYRTVLDEDSFATDLSAADAGRLPAFDEKMLHGDQWRQHEEEHHRAWQEQEEKLNTEYEQKWHASPVQHRQGSDRDITPDEVPERSRGPMRERQVSAADLTPQRLAGKFPGVGGPMVVPGSVNTGETTLHPAGTVDRAQQAAFGNNPPSPRWFGFEESIRKKLEEIRRRCPTCCRPGKSRVA